MSSNEFLDCCRIKKIFDKGFGFLTSIYFNENAFFHFSKIKDRKVRETLNNLRRGVVYVFYTSVESKGKRRAEKIWLNIEDVDKKLIPPFIQKIIQCFYDENVKTNPYELAEVVLILRKSDYINKNQFEKIVYSSRFKKIPSLISAILSDEEKSKIENYDELIEEADSKNQSYMDLCHQLLSRLY
jgi:cold shock CspA family protein